MWFLTLALHLVHGRRKFNPPLHMTEHPDMEKMVNCVFGGIRSQQSVIFTHNDTIPESRALIKALANKTTTYVLDVENVKNGTDRRLIQLKFFTYPRHSTMYFVLKRSKGKSTFDEVENLIREIGELSPVVTRPRCLLILYDRIRSMPQRLYHKFIQSVLDFAWSMKFLDFTIAHFFSEYHPMIFHMNPYRNEFVKFQFNNESASMFFPRKLVNAKNYTVEIKLGLLTNGSCIYTNKNDEIEMFILGKENWFIYLKQFFDYTGISVDWDVNRVPLIFAPVLRRAFVKSLSMNQCPAFATTFFQSGNRSAIDQIETSRFFEFERFDLLVPPITTARFQFPWEIIETGVSFLGMILTYYISTRIMNLPRANWTLKRIIPILMGKPIEVIRQCFVESAVFISLSLVSLTVTGDLVGSFLGFLKEENVIVYETLEEINDTGMKIMIYEGIDWYNDNDTTSQELKKKVTIIEGNPAEYTILSEPFIGLAPASEGAILANLMKKLFPSHPHLFLASNITLFTAGKVLPLEKNSPWVDTFNTVAIRTREFGLDIWATNVYETRCLRKEGQWHNFQWESPQRLQNISSQFVLSLYMIGIFFALVAFTCEIDRFQLVKKWRIFWQGIWDCVRRKRRGSVQVL